MKQRHYYSNFTTVISNHHSNKRTTKKEMESIVLTFDQSPFVTIMMIIVSYRHCYYGISVSKFVLKFDDEYCSLSMINVSFCLSPAAVVAVVDID